MVLNDGVHGVLLHLHVTLKDSADLANPSVFATVHDSDVFKYNLGELLGVNVSLQDIKDFGKELLLMEIVKLEGGVHPVDNGMLVDESWELLHDLADQLSGVAEVVHDVAARGDLVVLVQAVVESSNIVDVVHVMDHDMVELGVGSLLLMRSFTFDSLFGYFGLGFHFRSGLN